MPSLLQAFSELPDGRTQTTGIDFPKIADWLSRRYKSPESKEGQRRDAMRMRLDLMHDRGMPHFEKMFGDVFQDTKVRAEHKRLLKYARFQNVTRRIVSELSTVYDTETRRSVSEQNERYQHFLKFTNFDQKMRRANEYANATNDVLVWLRVATRDGKQVPVVEVISADSFTPIPHPLDSRFLIGVVLDAFPDHIGARESDPHYQVWSSKERFDLDRNWRFIGSSNRENTLGEIPGVLIHREMPTNGLVDMHSGEDIIQAHFAVAMLMTLMLRGQKVGTKTPYVQGDTAEMARGQTMDSNTVTEIPDDVQVGTLDLRHDPESLIESARAAIAQAAANYGIPEDVFHQNIQASSGFERDLKMVGLRQRRQEQILIFRDAERELARKASLLVQQQADEEFRFGVGEWSIQFGDVTSPMSPSERNQFRKEARRLGVRSALDDIMEDDPDVQDRNEALAKLNQHVMENAEFIDLLRRNNISADADALEPGNTPQQNGAEGGRSSGRLHDVVKEALIGA